MQAFADPGTSKAQVLLAMHPENPRRRGEGNGEAGRKKGFTYRFDPDVVYACAHYPDVFPAWIVLASYMEANPNAPEDRRPSDGTISRRITAHCQAKKIPTPLERRKRAAPDS